jgi:hypothetical protein
LEKITMRYPTLRRLSLTLLFAGSLALALSGCTVHAHDDASPKDNKASKEVDIRTPFGSLSVHNNTSAKDAGMADYPGAVVKREIGHDGDSSASVNISSSLFGLKLVALKFESNDPPEKILNFYRKDLARYGKVLNCTGRIDMNFNHIDNNKPVSCDSRNSGEDYTQELKVGTENNQRVVAIKPTSRGSEFALVYVRAHGDQKDTQ